MSKKWLVFTVLFIVLAVAVLAETEKYPTKPVNVVVAYAAGGASDLTARLIAEYWKKNTGNEMVVTNVVGAEGAIAARQVHSARPDGYTVLWYHEAMLGNYYLGVSDLNWYHFVPACVVLKISTVSVTRPDMPWKDLKDAVEAAKASLGKYVYGLGTGGVAYWVFAGLDAVAPGAWRTVPFEGGDTQRATALLGGHIDFTMISAAGGWSFLKSGQVKPLAVHDEERNPLMPDVPTAKELGYPDIIFQLTNTFFFPPKTPAGVVEEFNRVMAKIVEDPEFQKKAAEIAAAVPYFKTGSDLETFWKAMDARYKSLAESMNKK